MANKVLFEIVATAKGVNIVQKQTDKLAKSTDKASTSTDKLTKSRDTYSRKEKGVAAISSNQTKNFSKMQQGIDGGGGSGGLVRAYALLAANVFALTAAFGVLSRSAQIDTLTESMEILSTTGGTYIKSLAKDMQAASGGAIDLAQSFRQVSLASSAGLSTTEIEGLTQVAKGAAISLGRDLPDAMDRIFRGAIKLEPEILDEIGLFVRVDEAAQKYATSIGKSAGALTQAEKRQGFLNEILEQGKNKFQEYADTVKPDPYVRLGAALGDIAQSGISLLNSVLGPVLNFLAESKTMLTVVFGVLVFSLLKKAIPAMGQFNAGLAKQAALAAKNAKDYTDGVTESTNHQLKEDKKKVKSALAAQKKMNTKGPMLSLKVGGKDASAKIEAKLRGEKVKGLTREKAIEQRILDLTKKQGLAKREMMPGYQEELDALRKEKALMEEIVGLNKQKAVKVDPSSLSGRRQENLNQKAGGLAIVSGATDVGENEGFRAGMGKLTGDLKKNEKGLTGFTKATTFARGSVSLMGGAISRLTMMLGPYMMLFSMLAPILMGVAKWLGIGSEESKKFDDSLKSLSEMQEKINKRFDVQTDAMNNSTLTLLETTKATLAYNKAQSGTFEQLGKLREEFNTFQAEASRTALAWEGLKSAFNLDKESKLIKKESEAIRNSIRAATLGNDEEQLAIFASLEDENVNNYISKVKELGTAKEDAAAKEALVEDQSEKNKRKLEKIQNRLANVTKSEIFQNAARTRSGRELISLDAQRARHLRGLSDEEKAYVLAAANHNAINTQAENIQKKVNVEQGEYNRVVEESAKSTKEATLANQAYVDAQKGAITSFGKFKTTFDIKTKVDDIVSSFDELGKTFENFNEKGENIGGDIDPKVFFEKFADTDNAFTALFSGEEIENIAKEGGRKIFDDVVENVKKYQEQIITTKSTLKEYAAVQKLATKGAKFGGEALAVQQNFLVKTMKLQMEQSNVALKLQERTLIADETNRKKAVAIVNSGKTIAEQEADLLELGVERKDVLSIISARREDALLTQKHELADATKQLRINMAQEKVNLKNLEVKQKLLDISLKQSIVSAKLEQAAATGSTKLSARDEAEATMTAARMRLDLEIKGAAIKKKMLDYEFKILKLEMIMLAKQSNEDLGISTEGEETGMFKILKDTEDASAKMIDDSLTLLKDQTTLGFTDAIAGGFKGGLGDGLAIAKTAMDAYEESLRTRDKEGNITSEEPKDKEIVAGMNLAVMRGVVTSMGAELAKLGPEGEFVNTVVMGAMAIGDAFHTMTKAMEVTGEGSGLEKAVAMAEFASAAIGQVTQMLAANSKQQIAEIDGQIDAEKRRDGKSKESLAKIAGMEKKKDAMQRKAFEQNKKMQMAQTVINTASGMMRAYKDHEGFTATALAVMIGALGAAQLAIISKTQYQSASSGDVAKPKMQMSIGKRDNKIDVARGASGGELSYMRGTRGTGNAQNFNPSGGATGKRGYAAGGEGILVGEQGPEIMRPSQAVDIIPNNRLGGSTNVNFSINAVDAAGVENLLVEQRGNIIRMIREAANDTGERFLETVDTQAYGSST